MGGERNAEIGNVQASRPWERQLQSWRARRKEAAHVEAVRRFDPARGARLSTYATLWIPAFIFKYAMDNVREVRVVRTREQRAALFQGRVGSTEISLEIAA